MGQLGRLTTQGQQGTSGESEMYTLIGGVVTYMCVFVKSHQPVHLKCTIFIVYKLCLSEVDFFLIVFLT